MARVRRKETTIDLFFGKVLYEQKDNVIIIALD